MKHLAVLLLALFLAGCGQPSSSGLYQSMGSEDKFRLTLDMKNGGTAAFSAFSNLGNKELDTAVQTSMSLPNGRWAQDGNAIVVTGAQPDGKQVTYRFARQPNGDLVWEKTGARLVKK